MVTAIARTNTEILKNLEHLLHPTNILYNTNSWEIENREKNQTCLRCYVGGGGTLAQRQCTLRDAIRCSLNRLFRRSKEQRPLSAKIEAILEHDAQIRLLWDYRHLLYDAESQTEFELKIFEKVVQLSLPMMHRTSRRNMRLTENNKRMIRERVVSAAPGILHLVRSKRPLPPTLKPPILKPPPTFKPPILKPPPTLTPPIFKPPILKPPPTFKPPILKPPPTLTPPIFKPPILKPPPTLTPPPTLKPPLSISPTGYHFWARSTLDPKH